MMTTTMTNAEIGEAVIAAVKSKEFESLIPMVHQEVEVFEPDGLPYSGTWSGPEGLGKLLETLMSPGDLTIENYKVHPTEDGLIMEVDLVWTSSKDGEVFRTPVVEIERLQDGLIREIDMYYKDVAGVS